MKNPKTIRMNAQFDAVDIPTMRSMSDRDYRQYVRKEGLFYVDHHDILRSTAADYPLATTLEQFAILCGELRRFRSQMVPRSKK